MYGWGKTKRSQGKGNTISLLTTNDFSLTPPPGHQNHMSLLPSISTDLTRHSTRLQLVRELKRKKQEAILGAVPTQIVGFLHLINPFPTEGTYAVDEKDADLFSDTSSMTGRSATTSLASSRMTGCVNKTKSHFLHKWLYHNCLILKHTLLHQKKILRLTGSAQEFRVLKIQLSTGLRLLSQFFFCSGNRGRIEGKRLTGGGA